MKRILIANLSDGSSVPLRSFEIDDKGNAVCVVESGMRIILTEGQSMGLIYNEIDENVSDIQDA